MQLHVDTMIMSEVWCANGRERSIETALKHSRSKEWEMGLSFLICLELISQQPSILLKTKCKKLWLLASMIMPSDSLILVAWSAKICRHIPVKT